MKKITYIYLFFLVIHSFIFSQNKSPLYLDENQIAWVDSTYNSLSLDEKIGQLFMTAAYSNRDEIHENEIKKLITEEKIGGIIFMQDDTKHQIELINEYQSLSKIPLLIGMDAEWDLSMRLKNTNRFPWAMPMGALRKDYLIYKVGEKIAEHLKLVGAHFNFAPDIDVNTNPNNPIIGNRSFGSKPSRVADKGVAYMKGMQDNHILASAKHFPGHGDTSEDSHLTLPTIPYDRARLDSIELLPFRELINSGITAIMVSHINLPAFEKDKKTPATLSKNLITNVLKNELGFKGIIITDALNMKGVTKNFEDGEIDYLAFEAGNDILLFSQAVNKGKNKIKEALLNGAIPMSRLEESVKKILMAKYFSGAYNFSPLSYSSDTEQALNDTESKAITQEIFEQAATLLINKKNTLPFRNLDKKKFAWLPLGEDDNIDFQEYLNLYTEIKKINENEKNLNQYSDIIISVHLPNNSPYASYKISRKYQKIIKNISQKHHVHLVVFGSPYSLKYVPRKKLTSLIIAYQNHTSAQTIIPQILFGAIPTQGILPVDVNDFKAGDGLKTEPIQRLGYTYPESIGISSNDLNSIEILANKAIEKQASPGMQIMAVKDAKVFYNKSFGHQTYSKKSPVHWNLLYDLASITKISATLPLLMKEYDENSFSLDYKLREIFPKIDLGNKKNITIKEILAHQSGLYPWIPFYKMTLDSISHDLLPKYYKTHSNKKFNIQVANNIYTNSELKSFIFDEIIKKENISKEYKYSDLGFYLFQKFLENKYHKPLDILAQNSFYKSMGMNFTIFNPLNKFSKSQIAPTEYDTYFRKQLLHGYVHDQGAAMLGGVAGHAGLFSNANDMAKLMQMYLNGGTYGGKRYISKTTLDEFTSYAYPGNRRGLGFDKQWKNNGLAYPKVSKDSFGHTGFTGTMVWADPKYNFIYIFISNRVNPSSENKNLITENYRQKIQEVFYNAFQ